MLPLVGRVADLVDRRRVLLACLGVFVVGSAVTALATDLPVLVTGRVVQGVGGGGLVPATLAIVAQLWPADRRGVPLGVVGAVQELGALLGPVLGALVLVVSDWRSIFWLNAVLGVLLAGAVVATGRGSLPRPRPLVVALAVLAAAARRPRPRRARRPRDERGARAAVRAVRRRDLAARHPDRPRRRCATPRGARRRGPRRLGAPAARRRARGRPRRGRARLRRAHVRRGRARARGRRALGYALLPVGAALVGAYAVHHRRSASPLVPRGLLHGRLVWALVVSLLVGVALVAVVVDVPLLARLVHTESQTEAALVLVRFLLAVPVGALAGGWALRHVGNGVVAGVGSGTGRHRPGAHGDLGTRLAGEVASTLVLALTGLGIGLALAPVNDAALAEASHETHGTASALVVVARMVGMVVGVALLTAIGLSQYYDAVAALPDPTDVDALKDAAVVQVTSVFRGAAAAAALGAVASLGLAYATEPGTTTPLNEAPQKRIATYFLVMMAFSSALIFKIISR